MMKQSKPKLNFEKEVWNATVTAHPLTKTINELHKAYSTLMDQYRYLLKMRADDLCSFEEGDELIYSPQGKYSIKRQYSRCLVYRVEGEQLNGFRLGVTPLTNKGYRHRTFTYGSETIWQWGTRDWKVIAKGVTPEDVQNRRPKKE